MNNDTDKIISNVVDNIGEHIIQNTDKEQLENNYYDEIIRRAGCDYVDKEIFLKDVEVWCKKIQEAPKYNSQAIRNEIYQIKLEIPQNRFDYKEIVKFYSYLIKYHDRLQRLKSIVNYRYQLFISAYKVFKEYGAEIYTGTAVKKNACAEGMAHIFYKGSIGPKILLDEINERIDLLKEASVNMVRLLKEQEFLSKINNTAYVDGSYYKFNEDIEELEEKEEEEIFKTNL